MKIALRGPIAWRTPPRRYGPWEQITGLLADGLAQRGIDVPLFATLRSIALARLEGSAPGDMKASAVRLDPAACRQAAEQRFSADRMVDSYLDVYERVLCDR
jgi:hypothetical protein